MKLARNVLLAVLALSACSVAPPGRPPGELAADGSCVVLAAQAGEPGTKLCRVSSPSHWSALALRPGNRLSESVHAAVLGEIARTEGRAEFYVSLLPTPPAGPALRLVDAEGWFVEALLRSAADKTDCSVSWDAARIVRRFAPPPEGQGQGEGPDPRDGKRCGNVAIVHSLLRLGVLTENEAFQGDFLNEAVVRRIDGFHGPDGGTTADQQRRAYASFDARIECTTAGLSGQTANAGEVGGAAATLKAIMERSEPVFDCSLAVYADRRANGEARFKHVEHVKRVQTDPAGGYEIETIDGLTQGTGAAGIPKAGASNTWGVGGSSIRLEDSTSPDLKRRYSQLVYDALEVRCCHVRPGN